MSKTNILLLFIILIASYFSNDVFAIELKTAAQNSSPKYYKSSDNQMLGLSVDIMQAIESVEPNIKFIGYQEFIPFKRLQLQLEKGQLDIFLGIKKTPSRQDKYRFSDIPLYPLNFVLAVRIDDNINIDNFDDIRALGEKGTLLTLSGSAASRFLKKQGGLLVADGALSPVILLKMLKLKRARFAFYHDLGLRDVINKQGMGDEIKILPVSFLRYSHYAAFSRKVPNETREKIEIALDKLSTTGELTKIYMKHYIAK